MQLTPIVRYIVGYHVGQFAPLGDEGKQLAAWFRILDLLSQSVALTRLGPAFL